MLYNLKEAAKRGAAFASAAGLVSALAVAILPSTSFADALNPLTDRSLTLSSSSPGWAYTDGSGNPTYAAPGTGPNGQKTGETFNFRVSTDTSDTDTDGAGTTDTDTDKTVKAMTFQYCTTPAGAECILPGNGAFDAAASKSNLDVHYTSAVEGTDFEVYTAPDADDWSLGSGSSDPYKFTGNTDSSKNAVASTGWTMTVAKWWTADNDAAEGTTENNSFTLTNSGSGLDIHPGQQVWVKLFASNNNYVTNPGSDQPFFVRMNTYDTATAADLLSLGNTDDSHVIDGGVTVANVMNQSIHITTKVLETMSFTVGTSNPDTEPVVGGHSTCDNLGHKAYPDGTTEPTDPLDPNWNLIKMGDSNTEYSLSSQHASDAYSWWRLSTNSSAGASVYYSGETLTNTVGDYIAAVGEDKTNPANTDHLEHASHVGAEQFGLALDQRTVTPDTTTTPAVGNDISLAPLVPAANYGDGGAGGTVFGDSGSTITNGGTAEFAFDRGSLTSPALLASESDQVINCSTGHVRYIGNILPSTPAGVYTTKINYIAAPQY